MITACVKQEKQIIGKHVYGNLYGCDPSLINDESFLKSKVIEAAKIAKMTVWDTKAWKFGGEKGGVSVMALVLESHVAIHTWSELTYATVDVFTCGEKSDPELAFDHIASSLNPKQIIKHFAD
ncbi:MAG: adenosylmethionine decarboxylase, partial [Candidatus Methanomethylicaceae archaeon]